MDDDLLGRGPAGALGDMLAAYDQGKKPGLKLVLLSQSLGCQVMSNYICDPQKAAWAD